MCRFGEWRRLCLSTLNLIQHIIYLASENSYANYFTREKITHGLFGATEVRGPLSKTDLS